MKYSLKNDNKIKELQKDGVKKDNLESKVDFSLIPYSVLERVAWQFTRGAAKYGKDNWKKATMPQAEVLFKPAELRHTLKHVDGQEDEDHAAAAITNIIMYEWHKEKNAK